jgi:carboxyl-terminal processing protease
MSDQTPELPMPSDASGPERDPEQQPQQPHAYVPTAPPTSSARSASPFAWVLALALAAVVGTLLFVGGYLAAGAAGAGSCAAPNDAFTSFCEAYSKLKALYVDQLDDSKLVDGAIQGMFEHGGPDQWSGYMTPEDYRNALSSLSGQFSGIGVEVQSTDLDNPGQGCEPYSATCVLEVVAPLPDSPAEAAGLAAGDRIIAIDGKTIVGMTQSGAVQLMRGEAGTDVTITIQRGSDTFDKTITRASLQQREVTTRMLDGNVGYIALRTFSDASSGQFRDGVKSLLDDGATSFVFDLRDDGGGYIDAANKIASEFIKSGLVFSQQSSGDEVKRWEATGDGLATDPNIPVVVLVNHNTASASEIVTAALQERGRATVVGVPTYGKNTVQLWEPLDNGGGVRITISRWFTPDHNSVAPDGIQPDVVVDTSASAPPGEDPFVQKALEVISQRSVGADGAASPAPSPASGGNSSRLVPLLSPFSWSAGAQRVVTA